MKTAYADVTAILRLVLSQPGERMPTSRAVVLVSSEVVEIESSRALNLAFLKGSITELDYAHKLNELESMLASFHLFPLDRQMVDLAKASFPVNVSAPHAIHVATAQVISREAGPLEFWTHLPEQAVAAAIRGFNVRGVKRGSSS